MSTNRKFELEHDMFILEKIIGKEDKKTRSYFCSDSKSFLRASRFVLHHVFHFSGHFPRIIEHIFVVFHSRKCKLFQKSGFPFRPFRLIDSL